MLLIAGLLLPHALSAASPPNVVIFFGDDWGWGDLGANWAPTKKLNLTPNLDKLAAAGMRFTDFHAGASVCTPSRAALLTGRLGLRTGVVRNFGPSSTGGLPLNETTIAEMLRPAGYKTGMVGKWHLGTANGHHPIDRGFDSYVGLPYSNDMGCSSVPAITYWDVNHSKPGLCPSCSSGPAPVGGKDYSCGRTSTGGGCIDQLGMPIFYNKTITEQPVDLGSVSTQYAHAGAKFVAQHAGHSPFFLYVANSHVHVPQNHAARFTGKSTIGPFGDALMEMDWEIGEIIAAVEDAGQTNNTIFFVSGDNGPWECKCNLTGSSGPYVGQWQKSQGGGGSSRKTTLWEGGHREVGLASWQGHIAPGGVTHALASTLDFLPTIAALTGAALPADRSFDGQDISPLLLGQSSTAHSTMFHPLSGSCGTGPIGAARWGSYKTMHHTGGAQGCLLRPNPGQKNVNCIQHEPPLLFDLSADPGESSPLDPHSPNNAAVLATMARQLAAKQADIDSSARSIASYAHGPAGTAANCCNDADPLCRCHPGPDSSPSRPAVTEHIPGQSLWGP